MPNYELGKIYKIVDYTNDNIYVGSTAEPTLARRMCKHKASYNCWLNPNVKQGHMRSFDIIKNGDFKIILLESYPCESKDQLCAREQYWMDRLVCINKNNAVHNSVEWRQQWPPARVREYQKSFGGDLRSDNCNLLKIDISIFD